MQNNRDNSRPYMPERSVVNYRPERPGYEFQRGAVAPVVAAAPGIAPAQPVVASSAPAVDTTFVPVDEPTEPPKTFSLVKAVFLFLIVVALGAGAYIAYNIYTGR
jgi:hypothetical protein